MMELKNYVNLCEELFFVFICGSIIGFLLIMLCRFVHHLIFIKNIKLNRIKTTKFLLKFKIILDVNSQYLRENQKTPLMYASKRGYVEIVKLLLESGATEGINFQDWYKMTALMYAIKGETPSPQIVKLLLENGADIELQSQSRTGITALIRAYLRLERDNTSEGTQRLLIEIMKLLLEYGATYTEEDNHYGLPCEYISCGISILENHFCLKKLEQEIIKDKFSLLMRFRGPRYVF